MITKDENTPHSPKASGVYRRVNIGVTIKGNIYMIMLLTDIFALFCISGDFNMFPILLLKIYIFLVMVYSTWLFHVDQAQASS